jgi:hypothetical protein
VKKTRQNKKQEAPFRFNRNGKGSRVAACCIINPPGPGGAAKLRANECAGPKHDPPNAIEASEPLEARERHTTHVLRTSLRKILNIRSFAKISTSSCRKPGRAPVGRAAHSLWSSCG